MRKLAIPLLFAVLTLWLWLIVGCASPAPAGHWQSWCKRIGSAPDCNDGLVT